MSTNIIHQGFSTLVTIDAQQLLCESVTLNESISSVDSGAGYGATQTGENMAMSSPYFLDFGEVSGSITYPMTSSLVSNLISWMNSRNTSKIIQIQTGTSSSKTLNECFWTSISFSTSLDSLLSADLGFYAKEKAVSAGTIGGTPSETGYGFSPEGLEYIAWHQTKFGEYDAIDWNFTINQDVLKKFFCEGITGDAPPVPKYVIMGMPTVDLSATILTAFTPAVVLNYLKDYNGTVSLSLGNTGSIAVSKMTLLSFSPQLVGDYSTINVSYKAHKIA